MKKYIRKIVIHFPFSGNPGTKKLKVYVSIGKKHKKAEIWINEKWKTRMDCKRCYNVCLDLIWIDFERLKVIYKDPKNIFYAYYAYLYFNPIVVSKWQTSLWKISFVPNFQLEGSYKVLFARHLRKFAKTPSVSNNLQ